jgi:murein DD-endopeptidase MepM/ murein hydrolase activator NlpD
MGIKDWWLKIKNSQVGDVIKHKHRFVVIDNDTFKEKFSFRLSGINLFVFTGVTVIVLIVLTAVLIAFTPLREYIPGYTDTEMIEQTYVNAKKIDSLETALADQEWVVATVQALLRGENMGAEVDSVMADSAASLSVVAGVYRHSKEDSLLRLEVESEDNRYEVKSARVQSSGTVASAADMQPTVTQLFFAPVKGNVVKPYSSAMRHYGVDIAAASGSPVNAAYSGTVVSTGFAAEYGHVIVLQHPAGVITIYRNNSALLKHQGDAVRAGEPIAFVGTGSTTELGPHLHMEVWVNGMPVNPEEYISF